MIVRTSPTVGLNVKLVGDIIMSSPVVPQRLQDRSIEILLFSK